MKNFKRKQLGVTMLELVVSLGIGVILLTALGRVYVTATNEDAIKTLKSELDESARQIFSTMARDVSLAGFVDNFDGGTTTDQRKGGKFGNKVLIQSKNIKALFNREEKEITALSLLTGKDFMLPIQGDDHHLTIIYQAKNSNDSTIKTGEDYRSLAGAYEYGAGATSPEGNISGWGMNCANATDAALINHEGERYSSSAPAGSTATTKNKDDFIYLKQDFYFDKDKKVFSCGMKDWNDNWKKPNPATPYTDNPPTLSEAGMVKAMVGDSDAGYKGTEIQEVKFRYTATVNSKKSDDNYTVAESVAGYYTDKILTHKGVKASDLSWGGVTGVEVCIVLAAAPTYGKKKVDIAEYQPKIPTCERDGGDDLTVDVSQKNFEEDKERKDINGVADNKYYVRYVRTLSAHNALFLR